MKTILVWPVSLFALVCVAFGSNVFAEMSTITYNGMPLSVNYKKCNTRPRVILSTDYGSWQNDGSHKADADEIQALTHFLTYGHLFDLRMVIASTSISQENVNAIKHAFDRYEVDRKNPNYSFNDHPTGADLNAMTYQGLPKLTNSTGVGYNTAHSTIQKFKQHAAEAASSGCELWVLVWGAPTDIAVAIKGMSMAQRNNLRILAIGSSNTGASGDPNARAYIESQMSAQISKKNVIFDDILFRAFQKPSCASSSKTDVYPGKNGREIFDRVIDGASPHFNRGLRELVAYSRYYAAWHNCPGPNYPIRQTESRTRLNELLKIGDAATTVYLLSKIGAIKNLESFRSAFENKRGNYFVGDEGSIIFNDYINCINWLYTLDPAP